jgi:hypothetical protein
VLAFFVELAPFPAAFFLGALGFVGFLVVEVSLVASVDSPSVNFKRLLGASLPVA